MIKVVKFGGSSLASASQFSKVGKIINADPERKFVVPSAPGKRNDKDTKVTDMLYACYALAKEDKSFSSALKKIKERYESIINGLHMKLSLDEEFKTIEKNFAEKAGEDYAASRGEYLNGIIMANYLGYEFVDPADAIRFDEDGNFMPEETDKLLKKRLKGVERAVVPGFYGATLGGVVKTFSRGGSDVTGSLVSKAVHATAYENWTDVSGFLIADPRIIDNPKPIKVITYRELRELSYMGASVLHEDAVFPVRKAGIPINIRNTNDPEAPGTLIVESTCQKPDYTITGIAGKKGFSVITMTKNGMSSELGVIRRVLEILERYHINVEYIPSGIDSVSLVVETGKAAPYLYQALGDMEKEIKPDSLHVTDGMAVVAAVGRKMAFQPGSSGKIFAKLGENGINIRMITQGPEELNIIVGVDSADFEKAIRVLYNSFVK